MIVSTFALRRSAGALLVAFEVFDSRCWQARTLNAMQTATLVRFSIMYFYDDADSSARRCRRRPRSEPDPVGRRAFRRRVARGAADRAALHARLDVRDARDDRGGEWVVRSGGVVRPARQRARRGDATSGQDR